MQDSERKTGVSRRHAVGWVLIAGGSTLAPASWRKPVVDSVLMPAHAQASTPSDPPSPDTDDDPPDPPIIPTPPAQAFGRVFWRDGAKKVEAIAGARIELTALDGPGVYYATSQRDGSWELEMPPGRYGVIAEAPGYFIWIMHPDVLELHSDVTTKLNITLVPSS